MPTQPQPLTMPRCLVLGASLTAMVTSCLSGGRVTEHEQTGNLSANDLNAQPNAQLNALIVRDTLNQHTSAQPDDTQMRYSHATTISIEMDGLAPEELVVVAHFTHPHQPGWSESVIHVYNSSNDPGRLPAKWPGETVMSEARLIPMVVDPDTGRQGLLVTKGATLKLLELHNKGLRDALSDPSLSPEILHGVGGIILMDDDHDGVDEIVVTEYDVYDGILHEYATIQPSPPVQAFKRNPETGYWKRGLYLQGDSETWLPSVWEAYLRAGHFERAVWVVPTLMDTATRHGIRLTLPKDLQTTVVDSFHKETRDEARAGLLMASTLLDDPYTLLNTITPDDRWLLQFVQWEQLLALSNDQATRDRVFDGWTAWRASTRDMIESRNPGEPVVWAPWEPYPTKEPWLPNHTHMVSLNPWRPVLAAFHTANDPRLRSMYIDMGSLGSGLWGIDVHRRLPFLMHVDNTPHHSALP